MRRLLPSAILSVVATASLAGNAAACLWDKELVGQEQQFKSSYLEQQPPPSPSPLNSPALPIAGAGVLLAVGSVVVVSRKKTPQAPGAGES